MKKNARSIFACSSMALLLLLLIGATSVATRGQSSAPQNTPAAPNSPATDSQECARPDASVKQFQQDMRTFQQDIDREIGHLEDQVKELDMSSPEFDKLQELGAQIEGQLGEKTAELAANAAAIGARAEALAQRVQEKSGEIFVDPGTFVEGDEESGWLGVEIAEVTPEKAKDLKLTAVRGVIITAVDPDSPAAKAGLKENDVITQYEGQAVEGTVQFRRLVRETPAGRTVALAISRDGVAQNLSVELGDLHSVTVKRMRGRMRDFGDAYTFVMPDMPDMSNMPGMHMVHPFMDRHTPALGIGAEDLTPQLGAFFGAPDNSGVLVREVHTGTPAEKAGLKAGDVIIQVDGKPVRSLDELRAQLREKSGQKSVNLSILRKGSQLTLPVEIQLPPAPNARPAAFRGAQS
jgi:serine protease Do